MQSWPISSQSTLAGLSIALRPSERHGCKPFALPAWAKGTSISLYKPRFFGAGSTSRHCLSLQHMTPVFTPQKFSPCATSCALSSQLLSNWPWGNVIPVYAFCSQAPHTGAGSYERLLRCDFINTSQKYDINIFFCVCVSRIVCVCVCVCLCVCSTAFTCYF